MTEEGNKRWEHFVADARPFTPAPSSTRRWVLAALLASLVIALGLGIPYLKPWMISKGLLESDDRRPAANRQSTDADNRNRPSQGSGSAAIAARRALTKPSDGPSSVIVYKCKSYGGAIFWSLTHCNQHRALVDRMERVSSDLSAQAKLDFAKAQASSRQQAARESEQRRSQSVASKQRMSDAQSKCLAIEKQIEQIDAYTRQPLSGAEQDRMNQKRLALRDQQFRSRCRHN